MADQPNGKARWSFTRFVKRISDATNTSVVEGKYDSQLAARAYFDVNELYVAAAALDAAIDQLLGLLSAQMTMLSELPGRAGHHPQGHQILCEGLARMQSVDYAAAVAMVRKASARYYSIRKGISPREGEA